MDSEFSFLFTIVAIYSQTSFDLPAFTTRLYSGSVQEFSRSAHRWQIYVRSPHLTQYSLPPPVIYDPLNVKLERNNVSITSDVSLECLVSWIFEADFYPLTVRQTCTERKRRVLAQSPISQGGWGYLGDRQRIFDHSVWFWCAWEYNTSLEMDRGGHIWHWACSKGVWGQGSAWLGKDVHFGTRLNVSFIRSPASWPTHNVTEMSWAVSSGIRVVRQSVVDSPSLLSISHWRLLRRASESRFPWDLIDWGLWIHVLNFCIPVSICYGYNTMSFFSIKKKTIEPYHITQGPTVHCNYEA